jgi:hypothetical protein
LATGTSSQAVASRGGREEIMRDSGVLALHKHDVLGVDDLVDRGDVAI